MELPILSELLMLLLPPSILAQDSSIEQRSPLIERLDDATRAKVLAAFAGLIILGFAMVLLTWLFARVIQRYRRGTPYFKPTRRPHERDAAP